MLKHRLHAAGNVVVGDAQTLYAQVVDGLAADLLYLQDLQDAALLAGAGAVAPNLAKGKGRAILGDHVVIMPTVCKGRGGKCGAVRDLQPQMHP